MNDQQLIDFVVESNRIEGIMKTYEPEIEAHREFLKLETITVADLQHFVSIIQPDAKLRDTAGLNVRIVGSKIKREPGGPLVGRLLNTIVGQANAAAYVDGKGDQGECCGYGL